MLVTTNLVYKTRCQDKEATFFKCGFFPFLMDIPPHAKRVFSGVIFDVYHWVETLFDGSTATYEGLRRRESTQIIVIDKEDILLAYEKQPLLPIGYGFFGGHAEDGESPLECAKRELIEETGMICAAWQKLTVYNPEGRIDWKIHLFLARDPKQVQEPKLEPGEHIEVRRVRFDAFVRLASDETFRAHQLMRTVLPLTTPDPKKVEEFKRLLFP